MPELPEVENLRIGLARRILGQKIKKVVVTKPKLVSGRGNVRDASLHKAREFKKGLMGERFIAIERRAKNLIFKLSHGKILLAHLKMSGQFVYLPKYGKSSLVGGPARHSLRHQAMAGGHPIELSEKELPNKHTHIIFELEQGTLFYNDTRMFGYVLYYPNEKSFDKENHFASHGVEPLVKEFTVNYFTTELQKKSGKIKAVLMDQKIVTGLGNIYADESLFEAHIHPERKANTLSTKEITLLHKAIKRIIKRAIHLGGSSVATYRLLDLSKGNYAREHKVYGKEGTKCPRCKTALRKIIVGGRTTIFCLKCQK